MQIRTFFRALPILAALALFSCGGTKSVAQDAPASSSTSANPATAEALGMDMATRATPEQRADRQLMYLTERLTLREDQIDPVRAIALDYAERREGLRQDAGGDRRAMMQANRGLQESQDRELATVFDASQQRVYEQINKELREQMKERMQQQARQRGGRSGGRRRG